MASNSLPPKDSSGNWITYHTGTDITKDTTVVTTAHMEGDTLVIDDVSTFPSPGVTTNTVPDSLFNYNIQTHLWGCGQCSCDDPEFPPFFKEVLEDLDATELASLILVLPYDNPLVGLARLVLRQKNAEKAD